jgi:hypothetical protein
MPRRPGRRDARSRTSTVHTAAGSSTAGLPWRRSRRSEARAASPRPGGSRPEVAELRRFVADLDRRAAESGSLLDRALEETGRANDALTRARDAYTRAAASDRHQGLTERLVEADRKLRLARQSFGKGAERPVTALRLCSEAVSAANEVEQRARARGAAGQARRASGVVRG